MTAPPTDAAFPKWHRHNTLLVRRTRNNRTGAAFAGAGPLADTALLESTLPGLDPVRGKVRDVYDLGDSVLLVATDRISAFDWVLPGGVPDKGRVLTTLSRFWFDHLRRALPIEHHVLTCDVDRMPLPPGTDRETLRGRAMLCRKLSVTPFECVARGYLAGSGWNEYRESGAVCGVRLPPGLREGDRLPEPIFTPATKAARGDHDENVSFDRMEAAIGAGAAGRLREQTLAVYREGSAHAERCGILLADTKLEFGTAPDRPDTPILADEALTPDSSRFWPAAGYSPGGAQPSFDKQFVRDWLLSTDWDRRSPPPPMPEEVVRRTREKYVEAYERLTGERFAWA